MTTWLAEVRVATTDNIDIASNGLAAIDGVTLAVNDRILVKDQTTAAQNGIYVAAAGAWARAVDFPLGTNGVTPEATVRVSEGLSNAHTEWFILVGLDLPGPTASSVLIRNCKFDSFKYQISVDGGEGNRVIECNFGSETGFLTNELFIDNSNHSAYAIRVGLFDVGPLEAANVLYVDQCHFINSLYAILLRDGAAHHVTRCNFEQAVVATIQSCNLVTFTNCSNDGSGRDVFQLQRDVGGATSLFNFALRDCLFSGNAALINMSSSVGFPVATHALVLENVEWLGSAIPVQGTLNRLTSATLKGVYAPNASALTDGFAGAENEHIGILGTTINHYRAPAAALDINYPSTTSGVPAVRISAGGGGYVFSDKVWKTQVSGVFAGTFQQFDNVLSSFSAQPGARLGIGLGWLRTAPASGPAALGSAS